MPTLLTNVGYRGKSRSNADIAEPSLLDPKRNRNLLLVEITERSSTRAVPMYVNAFINSGGVLPPPASRTCSEDLVATGVVTQRRRDGGSETSLHAYVGECTTTACRRRVAF